MNRGRFLRISATAGVLLFGPYQRSLPKCATSNSQKRFTSPSSRTALSRSPASRSRRTSTAKKGARSAYFPTLTNQSNILHITDLENVLIPPGAFGTVVGVPISARNTALSQGKETLYSSGTMLAQPLTQLLRIHEENRIAAAEIATSRDDLKNAENEIALEVHTLYHGILVAQPQKKAAEQQTSFAGETLRENENDVRNGSALQVATLQGRPELHPVGPQASMICCTCLTVKNRGSRLTAFSANSKALKSTLSQTYPQCFAFRRIAEKVSITFRAVLRETVQEGRVTNTYCASLPSASSRTFPNCGNI